MKKLTIRHLPGKEDRTARIRVSYRADSSAESTERETDFSFNITAENRKLIQWYLEEYLSCPWGAYQDRAKEAEELMDELGGELFDAVFSNRETASLYSHVGDDLSNTDIVIHAADPAGISNPWELIRDPQKDYGLLVRLCHSFARSQPDLTVNPAKAPQGTSLNILMIISRPGGPEGDVPFQSVARPLLELFRGHRDRIHLDILRPPTFEQLEKALSEQPNYYQIIHFDGHGAFQTGSHSVNYYRESGEPGSLIFEGESGEPNPISGIKIGELLAKYSVPLILLNACQSGMTNPESLYPSIGNQILKAGARGVVAMAYSVHVETAVRFMARLFEELVNGHELGQAVSLSREELFTHPQRSSPRGEISLQDWIVPILLQSAETRPLALPSAKQNISLNLNALKNEQIRAGKEIDCPQKPDYGFIGRDSAILELERSFQSEDIVLLNGMAGIGKTETAVGFARWLAETSGLNGPIFYFKFENFLPLSQVCDRIGQVFHPLLKEQDIEWHLLSADERHSLALDILRKIPCLLIWDNFEPVAGFPRGSPSLWKTEEQQDLRIFLHGLNGGKTKVLLTSRRDEPWLGKIYHPLEITGLKLIEAQELAVRILRRALSNHQLRSLPDYTPLLKYLRGNPLALQVVLPELSRKSPDELLHALQSGEVNFEEDDPSLGRERSLAASLTYRLEALDPIMHKRLGLLGLFQGIVNANILAAICKEKNAPEIIRNLDRSAWINILDAVDEVGLLQKLDNGYYHIHPALPWFFHDLLKESFNSRLEWCKNAYVSKSSVYYYYLADLFNQNTEKALTLLRLEEPNATYVLRLARRSKAWGTIQEILFGLNQLMDIQGRWTEWENLVKEIYEEIFGPTGGPPVGCESLWITLLGFQAELAIRRIDYQTAENIVLHLEEHYRLIGDEHNLSVVLNQLGMIAMGRSDLDGAERFFLRELEIEERISDEYKQAGTLHQLGRIAQQRRQFDKAQEWYSRALAIKERIHDELGQSESMHQLGMIAEERSQFDEAEKWYYRSLEIDDQVHDERGKAITAHQLGILAQKQNLLDEAEKWYRQSLLMLDRIQDELGKAGTLHQLGMIAEARDDYEEAERWYQQGLEIAKGFSDKPTQAKTLHQLGILAQKQRLFDEAEKWYLQSLEINEEIHREYEQAFTLYQLGKVSEERGDMKGAFAKYQKAKAIFIKLDDSYHLKIIGKSLIRLFGKWTTD